MAASLNIDMGVISALLREGFEGFFKGGLDGSHLDSGVADVFQFVSSYWSEHQKMPDERLVEQRLQVSFRDVPREPMGFWVKEVKRRKLFQHVQATFEKVAEHMGKPDPEAAADQLKTSAIELEGLFSTRQGVSPYFGSSEAVFEHYAKAKENRLGIPTPYALLNDKIQGWQPQQLIVLAGRPGVGKSNIMIHNFIHAWKHGFKCLVISTEMSDITMRARGWCYHHKIPYGQFRRGSLSSLQEEDLRKKVAALSDDRNLMIMGDEMRPKLESIEAMTMIYRPHMVFIDGFYLLSSDRIAGNKQKNDKIAELLDLTKMLAKRANIPIMITTQMNRTPAGKGYQNNKPDLERLAFSDNMGMIADFVFMLDKQNKEDKEIKLIPVKTRESEFLPPLILNWDFDAQNFSDKRFEDPGHKAATRGAPQGKSKVYTPPTQYKEPDDFNDIPVF